MTTILSNGVKVPDVGSKNWASDLETNWQLLNACIGAVGSNVQTDRANTWTARQTFTLPIYGDVVGTATMASSDASGNDIPTTYATKTELAAKAADSEVVHLAGVETITGDKTFTGATATHNLTPETDNTYSLGSSSLKWGSVYANTYFYGSTQWGLDQRNEWTADNIVAKDTSPTILLKITNLTRGTPPSGTVTADFGVRAANENLISQLATQITSSGNTYVYSRANDGTRDQRVGIFLDATNDTVNYRTASNGVVNLGDSSHKWKTLNGVNPGALSLPSRAYNDSIALDTTDWDYAGNGSILSMIDNNGNYIPGWVVIVAEDVGDVSDFIKIRLTSYTRSPGLDFTTFYTGSQYNIKACFPTDGIGYLVLKLTNGASSIKYARYYPCLGNV